MCSLTDQPTLWALTCKRFALSGDDSPQKTFVYRWRLGDDSEVSVSSSRLDGFCVSQVSQVKLTRFNRGNTFLKRWMDFLEENADLKYPDVGEFTGK